MTDLHDFFTHQQNRLCQALEQADGNQKFQEDQWQSQLGTGHTRVLSQGAVFEKGGVNFSNVAGNALPASATQHRPDLAGAPFKATGVSLVIHPHNPFVPTTHMNIRLFQAFPENNLPVWWVGGGLDLTPYYGFEEDGILWHSSIKKHCDLFDLTYYPQFKKWCDEYFYLKHRQECRGIGGIFFDDLNTLPQEKALEFLAANITAFIEAYTEIVAKRRGTPFTPEQKSFQKYRRGRYVEFNLVYDRGTIFGLQSGGRTESILMSLPPEVEFRYNWQAQPDSAEARLTDFFLKPRDWV
jgi:coproporphyrinogen III oxidase